MNKSSSVTGTVHCDLDSMDCGVRFYRFVGNAPITLRKLFICDSYPLFLCLCIYFTYFLTLASFGFYMLFVLSALLFELRRLSGYSLSKERLYSFIFVHISYIFTITVQKSRQKRFSCSSTQEARSRPCANILTHLLLWAATMARVDARGSDDAALGRWPPRCFALFAQSAQCEAGACHGCSLSPRLYPVRR